MHVYARRLCFRRLGKIRQRLQRLLEPCDGLTVGRVYKRLFAGVPEISRRSIPELGTARMIGETLDVLHEAVGILAFDIFDDAGMQGAATFLEQRVVRDLPREAVLEDVLRFGKDAAFIQKFAGE